MSDENQKMERRVPPVGKRWKKGLSGNPKGRPRRDVCLTTLLKSEIEKICPADRQGRSWGELIVLATMQLAIQGNPSALKEVWERMDGKVMQPGKLELGGPGGKEVTIKIVYGEDGTGPPDDGIANRPHDNKNSSLENGDKEGSSEDSG